MIIQTHTNAISVFCNKALLSCINNAKLAIDNKLKQHLSPKEINELKIQYKLLEFQEQELSKELKESLLKK